MLKELLQHRTIILASGSPRRQQFFKEMDLSFTLQLKEIEEVYPNHLQAEEITNYLAELKAKAFEGELQEKDILVTSDTIVWLDKDSLPKGVYDLLMGNSEDSDVDEIESEDEDEIESEDEDSDVDEIESEDEDEDEDEENKD